MASLCTKRISSKRLVATGVIQHSDVEAISHELMMGCFRRVCKFLCCLDRSNNYTIDHERRSEEILYINIPRHKYKYFQEYFPGASELSIAEFLHMYQYVVSQPAACPGRDYQMKVFKFESDYSTIQFRGWVPRKSIITHNSFTDIGKANSLPSTSATSIEATLFKTKKSPTPSMVRLNPVRSPVSQESLKQHTTTGLTFAIHTYKYLLGGSYISL